MHFRCTPRAQRVLTLVQTVLYLSIIQECAVQSRIPTFVANGFDTLTDGRTDLLLHTLTMRGGHVASLDKFRRVVKEEIA